MMNSNSYLRLLDVIMPEILLRVIMGMFNVTQYEVAIIYVLVCMFVKEKKNALITGQDYFVY